MKYSNQYSKKSQISKYIYIYLFIYLRLFTYIHVYIYIYISKYNLYLYVFIRLPSFDFTGLPPTLSDGVTPCISVERKNGEFQGVAIGFLVELLRKMIHPQKLTWNLEMMVSNRNLLFQGSIFRFHVCFGGCSWKTVFFVDGKKNLRAKSC